MKASWILQSSLRLRQFEMMVLVTVFLAGCALNDKPEMPDTTRAAAETSAAQHEPQQDSVTSVPSLDSVQRGSASPTRDKLYPVDDADQDPSFFAFRAQLVEAVAARNHAYVLDQLSDDVRLSFGDDAGKADFVRMWNSTSPDSAPSATARSSIKLMADGL